LLRQGEQPKSTGKFSFAMPPFPIGSVRAKQFIYKMPILLPIFKQ